MGRVIRILSICTLFLPGYAGLSAGVSRTQACMIDGVATLRADAVRAVLNTTTPSAHEVRQWAPFIFKRNFGTAEAIRFSEDLRALARTLPPAIVHGHWLWFLGDGTRAAGTTVLHRYLRPGTYLITVAVALPHSRRTFTFDAALVHVVQRVSLGG